MNKQTKLTVLLAAVLSTGYIIGHFSENIMTAIIFGTTAWIVIVWYVHSTEAELKNNRLELKDEEEITDEEADGELP